MRSIVLIAIAFLATHGADPSAQDSRWAPAPPLKTLAPGDCPEATPSLKAYAFNYPANADPHALYTLGLSLVSGCSGARDWPLGCALLLRAVSDLGVTNDSASQQAADRAYQQSCTGFTDAEDGGNLCYWEGPPPALFQLGPAHWVRIERRQAQVVDGQRENTYSFFPDLPSCVAIVLPVVHTQLGPVDAPFGDPRIRHFLETFAWAPFGRTTGRTLFWTVYEVKGTMLRPALTEAIYETEDASYPALALPDNLRKLSGLRLTRDGQVEWIVRSKTVRNGIIKSTEGGLK